MNLSRLATLAVFSMMVLSAFVTIPNYYVGAEEDEDKPGAYFVFIMTTDRSDAITSATPFSLHFPAPPMSDNSPYELDLICEGDEDGFIDGIYVTWVHSEGGNAGDFNNITSWSVENTNGIQLEKFKYDPMSDIIDFDDPMVIFEDDEDSGGGHISAEVFDQEEFHCAGEAHDDGDHDEHDHDHDEHDENDHHGDSDGGEINPDYYHAVMTMNSIDNYTIEIQGEFLAERADEMRSQLADMCMTTTGSEGGVITDECFEMWLEMIEESDDDHHDDGHGDDGLPSPQDVLNMADVDGDSLLTFDELWNVLDQDDSHTDDYNHHDESDEHHHHGDDDYHHDHDDGSDATHAESDRHHSHEENTDFFMGIFDEADMDTDGHLDMMELEIFIQAIFNQAPDEHHDDEHHDDEFRCPPDMDDETCDTLSYYCNVLSDNLACMRMMVVYCWDNDSEMCTDLNNDMQDDDEDDGLNFIMGYFAYDEGLIDATTFMDEYIVPMSEDMSGDWDMGGSDGHPALFEVNTFNAETSEELTFVPHYLDREPTPNFICGDGSEVPFYYVNDGYRDCDDGADEQWYDNNTPDDYSDDCQYEDDEDCDGEPVNWFDCHDETQIWIYRVNDGYSDCQDGEDENKSSYWSANIYLFEGDYSDGNLSGAEIYASMDSYCNWADEDEVNIDCREELRADLVGSETYTLVTYSHCDTEWNEETEDYDYDCTGLGDYSMGDYSHNTTDSTGNVYWFNGTLNQSSMVTDSMPYNMYDDNDMNEIQDDNFYKYHVLGAYGTYPFEFGQDNTVEISFGAWNCHSYDDGEEDCHSTWHQGFYIYRDSFNPDNTMENLVGSLQSNYYEEVEECPLSWNETNCDKSGRSIAVGEFDLEAGEYYFVPVTDDRANLSYQFTVAYPNSSSVYFSYSDNADYPIYMADNTYEYDDDWNRIVVEGNTDRTHFPDAVSPGMNMDEADCYDDETGEEIDCDEVFAMFAMIFGLAENGTLYQSGDLTADNAASNSVELINMMIEMGMFDNDDDEHHHGDGYVDWAEWNYCEWEGDSSLQDGDMRWYCTDNDDGVDGFDDWWFYCEAHDDGMDGTDYFCTDDFGQSSEYESSASNDHYVTGGRPDDHGDHMSLDSFDVSSWDSANDLEQIVNWYNDQYAHHDSHADMTVDEFLAMCEDVSDEVNEEVAQCILDKALSMINEDRGDHDDHDHGDHDDMGPMVCYDMDEHVVTEDDNAEDCRSKGFMWVPCSSGPPGTCDGLGGDDDGNPPLLDGIVGVGGEDVESVFMSTNIVGSVSENQGLPIYTGGSFFLTFEGADDSLDVHETYIPVGEDGNLWHVEMVLLEDYEVISCDVCEDLEIEANSAKFNSNEPVTVRFGKVAEPLPDCDVVVTLSADGYAFEPAEVSINVGETVCWQWKDSTDVHNVDSVLDLEDYVSAGEFGSGEPSNTVDYRHTFTEDNATYYYVCEPHATMGMVGKVTVGEGAAEDPVEDILDESGLPSVGFVVGSLVLVGAAGLRRRIH